MLLCAAVEELPDLSWFFVVTKITTVLLAQLHFQVILYQESTRKSPGLLLVTIMPGEDVLEM